MFVSGVKIVFVPFTVSDLYHTKNIIIEKQPGEYYNFSPLATVDLTNAINAVQLPKVTPKLVKTSRNTPKKQKPVFSIESKEQKNKKTIEATTNNQPYSRTKRTLKSAADLQKVTPPTESSKNESLSKINMEAGERCCKSPYTNIPPLVFSNSNKTWPRDLRSSLLVKNAIQCLNSSTRISSTCEVSENHRSSDRNLDPRLPYQETAKTVRIKLLAPSNTRTTDYRKITFGNNNVISTGIPKKDQHHVLDTIVVDDDDDFDMFQAPPKMKSLPENIFEPVKIKPENFEDDNGNTIFNKDVLINSNSSSVFTLSKYESDLHLDEYKSNIAHLYSPNLSVLKIGERLDSERDSDDRVETLKTINTISSITFDTDPTSDGTDIEVKTKTTVDSRSAEQNSAMADGSKSNPSNEILTQPETYELDSNIRQASSPKDNRSLLDNLYIQLKLLEDIVYGPAKRTNSMENDKNPFIEEKNSKERVEMNTSQANENIKSGCVDDRLINHPLEAEAQQGDLKDEVVPGDVNDDGAPGDMKDDVAPVDVNDTTTRGKKISQLVNPESSFDTDEIVKELPVINEVQENQEILNCGNPISGNNIKSDEIIEILCNDPFANTFGKPDEVIIDSEIIELSNEEHIEWLQDDNWNGKTIEDIVAKPLGKLDQDINSQSSQIQDTSNMCSDELQPISEEQTCINEDNVSSKTIENIIYERICGIIKETDVIKLTTDEVPVPSSVSNGVEVGESKKKIAALLKIVLYFQDIINQNENPIKSITAIRFVKKLIDSTFNLYTIHQKHSVTKNKPKKTKSNESPISQKFKKLLSKSLLKLDKISRQNDPGPKEILTLSNDLVCLQKLSKLKQFFKKAETTKKTSQDNITINSILEQVKNKERETKCKENEITKLEHPADDYHTSTKRVPNMEDESAKQRTDMSDVNHDEIEDEYQHLMKPLLFSEIEEIIGTSPKLTEIESEKGKIADATTVPPNTLVNDDEPISGIKMNISLKTYSRKQPKKVEKITDEISQSKKNIANLENISRGIPDSKPKYLTISNVADPTKVSTISENEASILETNVFSDTKFQREMEVYLGPACRVRIPKMLKKETIKKEIEVCVEELPGRRISKRTKKRPDFYGTVCHIKNKKPKIKPQPKD